MANQSFWSLCFSNLFLVATGTLLPTLATRTIRGTAMDNTHSIELAIKTSTPVPGRNLNQLSISEPQSSNSKPVSMPGSDTGEMGILTAEKILQAQNDPGVVLYKGRFNVISHMPFPIKIHCSSLDADLGEQTFEPGSSVWHDFPLQRGSTRNWSCYFFWSWLPGFDLDQNVVVWAHDGRHGFLESCATCQWVVSNEGFFYLDALDGNLYFEYGWHRLN